MTFIKSVAAMAVTALIAGCGGGSDAPQAVSSIAIQGSAVKGPMAKAKISLYKITADGKQGDLLQETVSDDNGRYSVTLTDYSGVVLVVASVVAGQTTFYDEATRSIISPAADFVLKASFAAESGKTHDAQINPFTDMATAAAMAKNGGLSLGNVEQANADLAATLGFNPLTVEPTFDANKTPTNSAAGALAAVSQLALSGGLGCAAGEQAARVACVTAALSAKGLGDAGVKAALQTTLTLVNDSAGLPALNIGSSTPTPTPAATALDQAKAFIGALRSNAKALDAADLSLQTELQKVADDLHGRTAPLASNSITALNVARLGIQLWNDVIKGDAPFVKGQAFYEDYPNPYGFGYLGGCSFYQDTNYSVDATSKANAKYVACGAAVQSIRATNANGEYQQCSAVGEWCDTQWNYRVRLHPDATDANKFTIYTQTREAKRTAKTLGGTYPNSYVTAYDEARTSYGAAFPGNAAVVATQLDSNGKITGLNLSGELSPAFSVTDNWTSYYDNALSRWVYKPNVVATVLGEKHNVVLSAALSTVGNLDKLALSGSVELIKTGKLETRLELAAGSYLQATTGSYSAQDGSHEMLLKLKGGTAVSTLTGDLKISAFKRDASDASTSYRPTLAAFNGSVQRNGVAFFEGALTVEALNHARFNSNQPTSAANAQTTRAGFVGKVTIPSRPDLNVKLSATRNDTGSSATNTTALSGQYEQGLITINVSGTSSAAANTVTLETPRGLKLVIDRSKTSYPLTKDGQTVGEYATGSNRMTYSDSSYEQF